MSGSILNIAYYKFLDLSDEFLPTIKKSLLQKCRALNLKGTILLSHEGINSSLSGEVSQVEEFITFITTIPEFEDLTFKKSYSNYQPFTRMLVKIKQHIIPINHPNVRPQDERAPSIDPLELKKWYDENRDFLILDTRNDYELRSGKFKNAIGLNLRHFRYFPKEVQSLLADYKDKPIVTYCTGGIRCEKAAPVMMDLGFNNVYQLEGGILNYFEKVGSEHYEGDCFVFDQRVAINPALVESKTAQCFRCREPLTPEEQSSPLYKPGKSCPYCYDKQAKTNTQAS